MSKVTTSKRQLKTPEQMRQETKHKNQLFNRYMLFRYSLSAFFFTNLYWLTAQLFQPTLYMVLPVIMIALMTIATAEQFKLYGATKPRLAKTELALKGQALLQGLVVVLVFLGQTSAVFPTFSNHVTANVLVVSLQILGLALVALNLRRLEQIKQNKDKYYQRFQIIEKHL